MSQKEAMLISFSQFLNALFLYILLLLCFSDNAVIGESTEFDFGTLTLSSLKLLGDAHLNNGSVSLTSDLGVPNSGAGMVFYSNPIQFRSPDDMPVSFSTFFSFSITDLNPTSNGGGLAFVISPGDETVGEAGGFLGLAPSGFVAVEFDTLMNMEFKDINSNHVGLDLNSMISAPVADLGVLDIDLKSGDLVNSWIEYDGANRIFNISVSYANRKPEQPILSFNLDLDQYVNNLMYVGFSGSTQGSTEVHSLKWWSFSSSFASNSSTGSSSPAPPTTDLLIPSANSIFSTSPPPPSMAPSKSISVKPENSSKFLSCNSMLCKQSPDVIAGVVIAGVSFLAIFAGVLIWLYAKTERKAKKPEKPASDFIKMPKEFSIKELKLATKCFSSNRVIGHGAFGTVYKGIMPDSGDVIAVKRCIHAGGQGKAEFLSELAIIGSLRHRNLVKLQGWCHEKDEILLIYDLMLNGSLDKALFESKTPLPFPYRRKILIGVASALAYLHQECENQVIHRDIKTSNIMLDEGFNARLGDFGLARQIEHDRSPDATAAAGTMGYLAPEYLLTGRATEKTDVFSYGAVVLEVACGRRPIEREVRENAKLGSLVDWVWSLHREGRLLMAADEKLGKEFDETEMMKMLLVGLACSHPDPLARPTMRNVVQMLVGEANVPIVPRTRPSMSFSTSHLLLSLQDSVSDLNEMIAVSATSSSDSYTDGEDIV